MPLPVAPARVQAEVAQADQAAQRARMVPGHSLPARVTQARIRRRKTPVRMQVPWQAEPARVEVVRSREDQAARWLHLFAEHWRLLRAVRARTIRVRAVWLRALELGQLARGLLELARAAAVLAPREPAAQRAQS